LIGSKVGIHRGAINGQADETEKAEGETKFKARLKPSDHEAVRALPAEYLDV